MKKILLILLFVIVSANSQDFEPGQHKFNRDGQEVHISKDSSYFKQKKFLLGWHWGSIKKLTKSLLMNQVDADENPNAEGIVDSCMLLVRPSYWTHNLKNDIINARSIQFEPTIKLNTNKYDSLIIRTGDTTKPIFGFGNVRGRILTNTADGNYNRLIIDSSSLDGQVILSDSWPKDELNSNGAENNK